MRKLITCVIFVVTLGIVAFAATGAGADTVDTFSWGTPAQTTVPVSSFAPDQWAPAGTYGIQPSNNLLLIGQIVASDGCCDIGHQRALYDGYNVTDDSGVVAIVNGVILVPGSFDVGLLPTGAIIAIMPYDQNLLGTYTQAETFVS